MRKSPEEAENRSDPPVLDAAGRQRQPMDAVNFGEKQSSLRPPATGIWPIGEQRKASQ
jgi:hypothetical protein